MTTKKKKNLVERFDIRLTKEERIKLDRMVEQSGDCKTISQLFRFIMFADDLEEQLKLSRPKPTEVILPPEVLKIISGGFNNINQIAHQKNYHEKSGETFEAAEIKVMMLRTNSLITKMISDIKDLNTKPTEDYGDK